VYLLGFHAYINEMHGSRSKIPSKITRPYIHDIKCLALVGSPYIYEISRLKVNYHYCAAKNNFYMFYQQSSNNLDSKLSFHHHVNYLYSRPLKILTFISTLTCSYSATEFLLLLNCTFVRPQLHYDPLGWNNIKCADVKKLECVQLKVVAPSFSHIFPYNQGLIQVLCGLKIT
jgi:hypothetical protein